MQAAERRLEEARKAVERLRLELRADPQRQAAARIAYEVAASEVAQMSESEKRAAWQTYERMRTQLFSYVDPKRHRD